MKNIQFHFSSCTCHQNPSGFLEPTDSPLETSTQWLLSCATSPSGWCSLLLWAGLSHEDKISLPIWAYFYFSKDLFGPDLLSDLFCILLCLVSNSVGIGWTPQGLHFQKQNLKNDLWSLVLLKIRVVGYTCSLLRLQAPKSLEIVP